MTALIWIPVVMFISLLANLILKELISSAEKRAMCATIIFAEIMNQGLKIPLPIPLAKDIFSELINQSFRMSTRRGVRLIFSRKSPAKMIPSFPRYLNIIGNLYGEEKVLNFMDDVERALQI